uniref:Uncharacterized protein n=1 Tax=Arundo donax TaxID=35708 RepID=A0A0A9HUQ0_ARUDO
MLPESKPLAEGQWQILQELQFAITLANQLSTMYVSLLMHNDYQL